MTPTSARFARRCRSALQAGFSPHSASPWSRGSAADPDDLCPMKSPLKGTAMKVLNKLTALGVTAGLMVGGVMLATPASADPVSPGYVAVGSDTLQDSMNALTNGTAVTNAFVRVAGAGNAIGNFDAFGSTNIQTTSGGPFFARPGGSGAGITALTDS